ncbi:hypothetical protein [Marinomonas sp. 2405UD68-3]|uniref:hypothetical protein n=1 Tax=Marinomonas sp. 2405UD68-3 TaxID=3391835 RepID=UPI0039C9C7F3
MLRYFLLLFCIATDFSYGFEFWNGNAYIKKHPRQIELIKNFNSVVNSTAEPIQSRQVKTINISAILPAVMSDETRTVFLRYFKKRMQALQIDYRLDVFEYDSNVEDDVLLGKYKAIMQSPPDYLITTLERFSQKSIVEYILRQHSTHVILYGVSSPVVGWGNEQSVFYAGVNYSSTFGALSEMIKESVASSMEIIPIAFSKGYRNHQFCNAFLDVLSENKANVKQVLYFDDSLVSKKRILQRINEIDKKTFIFQCDNFVDATQFDLIEKNSSHKIMMNYWLSDDKELSRSDIQMIGFRIPFEEIEVSIAEMIHHHLEKKKFPSLYMVDLSVERS